MKTRQRETITQAALLGLAVGDALGVPVEFMSREEVRSVNLTEMIGKDTPVPFESRWGDLIPSGAWSDDTSMAVANMESMIAQDGDIDYDDVMNRFLSWWEKGEFCSLDFPFGLGSTVSRALSNFKLEYPVSECGPRGIRDNGNGALMRILPFSLYCVFEGKDREKTVQIINTATAITHGHPISKMGCLIFTLFLKELLSARSVLEAWEATRQFEYAAHYDSATLEAYGTLLADDFRDINEDHIGETGYVVDSWMAAVHSMLRGSSYEDTVLLAINLGYDTDTNAAITGALAGAFYGLENIPRRWLMALRRKDYLEGVALRFAAALDQTEDSAT